MPQFARPSSDVTTGAWTPTPLWSNIDEPTASDADFISCNVSTNDFSEVAISAVQDPSDSTNHIVRYRYRKNASSGNSRSIQVGLYQGGTQIAVGSTHTPTTTTWTAGTFTLTGTQADAITDYANLRLRFIATGTVSGSQGNRRAVEVSWAELEVPSTTIVDSTPRGIINRLGETFNITSVEYRISNDDIISVTFNNATTRNGQVVLRDSASATSTYVIDAPAQGGSTTVNDIPAGYKMAASIELRLGGAL